MSRSRDVGRVCVLLALAACDGLGRAIVSEGGGGTVEEVACLRKRPVCKLRPPVAPSYQAAPVAGELPPCQIEQPLSGVQRNLVLDHCELGSQTLETLHELVEAELRGVRIALGRTQRLSVRESALVNVAVVKAETSEEEQGDLLLSHSKVSRSALAIDRVELVSSSLERSFIEADQLFATDVVLREMDLAMRHGQLAAAELWESRLRGCEAGVLLAGSEINDSRIACAGRLQVYASSVDRSNVDGEIEAQSSDFADGAFGLERGTTIESWHTTLSNSIFCQTAQGLRTSSGELSCNLCERGIERATDGLCVDPQKPSKLQQNPCEAIQEMPECESFPRPRRPIDELSSAYD